MPKNNFYPVASSNKEIDLRAELINTIYGSGQEIAKGQRGLIRLFRRDVSGNLIPCACVSPVTQEPDKDTKCPVCLGEGNLWDEQLIDFYSADLMGDAALAVTTQFPHSTIIGSLKTFYIPSTFTLTGQDKIVLLMLDREGSAVIPLRRRSIFTIATLRDLRLDNARLEFWKANAYEDINKFL